ncbi:MAG: endonuclease/exonuclease/phosphatase family protein [Phycisphaerae bacterium]
MEASVAAENRVGRAQPGDRGAGRRVALRLATYNVEGGRNWPAVLANIRAARADVICLQEVLPDGHGYSDGVGPTAAGAALGGSWCYELLWHWTRRPVGNMTLSRGRVGAAEVLAVGGQDPYGIMTPVEVDGVRLWVVNVHLAAMHGPAWLTFAGSEPARRREALDLRARIAGLAGPAIVMGDFNTFWPAPAYCAAARGMVDCRRAAGGRHAGTRPTYGIPFVIDHILVTPDVAVVSYGVAVESGSDHRLVSAAVSVDCDGRDGAA